MDSRGKLSELEYCGSTVFKKDVEKNVLLAVHWKEMSMIRDLESMTCEDRLKDLELFLPGIRRVGRGVKEEVKAQ